MIYPLSATSQSIDIQIVDDTGLPVTSLVAATFPTLTYSLAGANADVAFPALSDLTSLTTAWAAGGVKERGNGVYRLDLPNGVFTTAGEVKIRGEATGKHVIAPWIDVAVTVANVTNKVAATLAAGDVTGSLPANVTEWAGTAAAIGSDNLPKVGLWGIMGSLLTQVTGNLAGGFSKLLDVLTPIFTVASTNQTGDSYPVVTNATYGNSALNTAITNVQTSVSNINNLSALATLIAPSTLVRPSSGSIAYPFTFVVKDAEGHLIDVDTNAVTLTATNSAGVDRSASLSAVTHAGTGEYTFTYTVANSAVDEGLRVTAAGTVQSATRKGYANCDIADADSLSALAAIQAQTDKLAFDASNNVKSTPQTAATLTSAYDAAKTAAAPGAQMDLVSTPNAVAVTAIQNGLSKPGTAQTIDQTTALPASPVAGSIGEALKQADKLAFTGANLQVVVEAYAANEDPWSIIKAAIPSGTPAAGSMEEIFQLIKADQYTDQTTDPTQWHCVYVVAGSGSPGVGHTLATKKLFDTSGAKVTADTQVIGQAST